MTSGSPPFLELQTSTSSLTPVFVTQPSSAQAANPIGVYMKKCGSPAGMPVTRALNWSPHCSLPVPQHSSPHDAAGRKSRWVMVSAENPPVTSPPIHKSQPSHSELPDSGAVTSPTASAETLPFTPCTLSPPLRDALPPNGHSCHSLTALTSLLKNHLPGEPFLNHQSQPNP